MCALGHINAKIYMKTFYRYWTCFILPRINMSKLRNAFIPMSFEVLLSCTKLRNVSIFNFIRKLKPALNREVGCVDEAVAMCAKFTQKKSIIEQCNKYWTRNHRVGKTKPSSLTLELLDRFGEIWYEHIYSWHVLHAIRKKSQKI